MLQKTVSSQMLKIFAFDKIIRDASPFYIMAVIFQALLQVFSTASVLYVYITRRVPYNLLTEGR